ncbi:serine/threonine-protein kinase (plasmid) [Streptomyces yangpuensis]|uniref:Serine/threonine-protein kinase n=1 Tax=Streptomyces yangpuensis TaxID=1648182 RepID=A0ABY5Q8H4_9ACTN|nr:serine/threonine-protein kinase [Streptomyces yangpuensis]UUY52762.1 serine/threonine-protein kinase [Streptomyces yangpuensis]
MGRYKIVARLGSGGMGRVYLGRSPGRRPVAVKVVRPELAGDGEFRRRFKREVMAAQRVNGAFTAGVIDADPDGSPAWMATVYVPGPSLGEALAAHGPWPLHSVLALAAGMVEALEVIHAAGVIHRDLKPSNVLLAADGPRIIDFGISVAMEASTLTRAGVLIGTPGYMSPEQLLDRAVTPASDVFALGAVLAYTATGVSAFGSGSSTALCIRTVQEEPSLDALPGELRDVVAACLAKEPDQRPTVATLLDRLTGSRGKDGKGQSLRPTLLLTEPSWMPDQIAQLVQQNDPPSPAPDTRATVPGGPDRRLRGSRKWSYAFTPTGFWATPRERYRGSAASDGLVYCSNGALYAVDVTSGEQRWAYTSGGRAWSSPTVVQGLVYFGSDDGRLYAVDARSGEKRWSFTTGGTVRTSPAVAGGVVYVGSDERGLHAVSAETGEPHWAFTTGGMVRSSPTVVEGIVYFGSDDGRLYALDARSGEKRWSFTTGRKVRSSPAVVDGVVYVGSDNGKLHAVDADTGRERWSFHTKARLRSSPAVANGTVYLTSTRIARVTDRDVMPKLYAVDTATGRERWSYEIGSHFEALSPVVANGIVYVAFDYQLCALQADTGLQHWVHPLGNSPASSPVVADGVAYLSDGSNRLYAVQT